MKHIIVPVDLSEESMGGLQVALLFARKVPVTIHLVHVMQKVSEQGQVSEEEEHAFAEKQLKAMVEKYSPGLGKDSKLQYFIRKGRIFQEIVDQAQSWPETLIAASTHGASGFQELFIGSNAYRILSATDKPVITIRGGNCPLAFARIVLPIDTTIHSRQKVPFTIDIARIFDAEIHVVGVQTSKSEREVRRVRTYTGQVAGFIQGKARVVTNEVWGSNVAELVVNYARSVKADLISITTEKSSGLGLILGNTAHLVLNKSDVPVLLQSPKSLKISGTFSSSGG